MIQAVKLTKRFEDITAVDHIDAAIREGSVFGLIGTMVRENLLFYVLQAAF